MAEKSEGSAFAEGQLFVGFESGSWYYMQAIAKVPPIKENERSLP
jgi:hypothetical protein